MADNEDEIVREIPIEWVVPDFVLASRTTNIPAGFEKAIARLKTRYKFDNGQDEDTLAVLSRYPFLIGELNKIHEIKCQYFDDAPMSLYYQPAP